MVRNFSQAKMISLQKSRCSEKCGNILTFRSHKIVCEGLCELLDTNIDPGELVNRKKKIISETENCLESAREIITNLQFHSEEKLIFLGKIVFWNLNAQDLFV